MSSGWEYRNQKFSPQLLKHLKGSFAENYKATISSAGAATFVKCYSGEGLVTEKTFFQFDIDVRRALKIIAASAPLDFIVCTKSDNNYFHLCFIMATLLSGRRLCLLNPSDSPEKKKKKINLLKEKNYIVEVRSLDENDAVEAEIPASCNIFEDFIYIFTSGTTGESKIVRQTQAGALANLDALVEHHDLGGGGRVIATPLPVFHVNALHFSFFGSFFSRSKLILFQKFDPILLIKSIKEDKVEIVSVVPHILATLLKFQEKIQRLKPYELKYFVSAASGLPVSIFNAWIGLGYKIIQGYGMSEGINFSLKTPINIPIGHLKKISEGSERASVGLPVYGNEVRIFDEADVAIEGDEIIGQIGIKGWNLMPGYKNIGEVELNSSGFFKTGDLGFTRTFEGQRFFFIGARIKEIAKPMGVMVALPSLDEKIKQIIGNSVELMTFSIDDNNGERIGLVLVDPFSTEKAIDVSILLKQNLLSHESPAIIICTGRVIRSESGKLIRGLASKLISESQSQTIEGISWHFPKLN